MAGQLCRVVGVDDDKLAVLTLTGEPKEVRRDQCYDDPRVGDITELVEDAGAAKDAELWAFERIDDARFVTCAGIRPRSDGSVTFLAGRQPDQHSVSLSLADLGLADFAEAQRLQGHVGDFTILVRGGSMQVGWPPGGLGCLREAWAAKASDKRLREARSHARRADVFVNPYTYVPLPTQPAARAAPRGHDGLHDAFCGWFDVTYTALSPLMVRDGSEAGRFPRKEGEANIPGSSVKGAIRSLHEALTGSCVRVVDTEYEPVYRQQAKVLDGWKLAVVEEIGHNNRIDRVQLCDAVARVPIGLLHGPDALGGWEQTRTGARVALSVPAPPLGDAKLGWPLANEARRFRPGTDDDEWVILVTDARARHHPTVPYRCAAGRLTAERVGVTAKAWADYLDLVEGTDDLKVARAARKGVVRPVDKTVEYPEGTPIGVRRTAARGFAQGDVVWVKVGPQGIEAIQLSQVWREKGSGPVGERLAGFKPCDDVRQLCPSCRLFGAADTRGDRPGRRLWGQAARQDGYGGHVRVGDAVAVGDVEFTREELAPLGEPRLGAGQFTLDNGARLGATDPPANRWGSAPDTAGARRLRGRRFYWHGYADEPELVHPPRHRRRPRSKEKMTSSAELARPGATFRARVHVDGVALAQLGSLLVAIDPNLALAERRPPGFADDGRIATRLGGGKPFGFGTVTPAITDLHVETAASRYGGGEAVAITVDEAVVAFVEDEAVPEAVRTEVWPALAAVLHTGQVNVARLWYPPGDTWKAVRAGHFDRPFAFFQRSAGTNVGKYRGDMVPLPDPTEPDQSLPVNGEEDR